MECDKEEVEDHLRRTHSDPHRDEQLEDHPRLLQLDEPNEPFDESEPRLSEVRDVIKKARAASAPGPSGVPYKVYKKCPALTKILWKLIRVIWRRGRLTDAWLKADGCFIPKEENSKGIKMFRTISLLNVEGKICLAILARRFNKFLLRNSYIDTTVQKGGVTGVPGCLEHTSAVTQLMREAKENKGDLAVIWLDLANAYGSIPHQVIQTALKRYHVPEKFRTMLQHYFDNFRMRFSVGNYNTAWQRLEVGIVTGCTISVVLFAATMNLLVKSAENIRRGPVTTSGIRLPPTRAFMDDLTITTKSVIECRWMLEETQDLIEWARMKFKPEKSRSLVWKNGKVQDRFRFRIGDAVIPTVQEKPVKSLGKWFTHTLKDQEHTEEMLTQAQSWMKSIDASGLPGKYKAWCYQHGILPRLIWPMLMYDIPLSKVESMERKINSFLRRWLGVPGSFSSIGLYSTGSKLQLPLKSVTEEYKVTKARMVMMLKDSKDDKIRQAGIETRTGRKWDVNQAVEEAESRLRHSDIVGTTTHGRLGLGCITRTRWKNATAEERRELVQSEVRHVEEQDRMTKAVSLRNQGAWMKWDTARPRRLSWSNLWAMEHVKIKFLLRSTYDVLPTPTNLHKWGLNEDPRCKWCGRPGNLEHVLSSCKCALTDGRYRWRHDKVLAALARCLEEARARTSQKRQLIFINFVKAGGNAVRAHSANGVLSTASDWEMLVDLHRRLKFPSEIAETTLRPDIVIWSKKTKQVVLVELTVPWEERMEEAHERKKAKYQPLLEDCQDRGWRTWNLPVEVGCRGFVGQSLWRCLGTLGIKGKSRGTATSGIGEEAEAASRWIWYKRDEQWKS